MEVELSAVFLAVYGALQSGLVTPLAQLIKKNVEKVFKAEKPFTPMLVTYALSLGCAYGVSLWLQPGIPIETLILLVMAGKAVANDTHAIVKSVKKGGKK